MALDKGVIIITGSSGRIGTRVAERFADRYQIVGFDFVPSLHTPPSLDYVKVDLESDKSVQDALNYVKEKYGTKISAVVHLAAYYNFTGEPSNKYQTITVQGTRRMLQGLQGFECDQFMFSSTMLVHAPCEPGQKITENSPLLGLWDYPRSKIETEAVMRKEHGHIPIVVHRIAGCYDDYCNSIPLSNQIQRIYERQFQGRVYPGDLNRGTSYIHMDDLVDCIEITVEKRKELPNELFVLVGEDRLATYGQLQQRFGELLLGEKWTTFRIPKFVAKIGAWLLNITGQSYIKPWMIDLSDINYDIDISRAKEVLGWQPKRFVSDVAAKMVDALKQDPVRWYQWHKLTAPSWLGKK